MPVGLVEEAKIVHVGQQNGHRPEITFRSAQFQLKLFLEVAVVEKAGHRIVNGLVVEAREMLAQPSACPVEGAGQDSFQPGFWFDR